MNSLNSKYQQIKLIESIMLDKFISEPFHNLYLLAGTAPKDQKQGGTCSDKTISLIKELKKLGISAQLHSSLIDNKEIHRLVSIHLDKEIYFADIGNGWPSIKLFPKHQAISYQCFGIKYRTEIKEGNLVVYQTREGIEKTSTIIPFRSRSQEEILRDIEQRFSSNIVYPFKDSVRISRVVNDCFLFLRDTTIYKFQNDSKREIFEIDGSNAVILIKKLLKFDISTILDKKSIQQLFTCK